MLSGISYYALHLPYNPPMHTVLKKENHFWSDNKCLLMKYIIRPKDYGSLYSDCSIREYRSILTEVHISHNC